ncbi:uncharacterized protein [Montipora capricornis]|uniref:uncharacterized protein n=1 Tax=Montipora capricornis TaxID=246305 RepID=UPI0035F18C83
MCLRKVPFVFGSLCFISMVMLMVMWPLWKATSQPFQPNAKSYDPADFLDKLEIEPTYSYLDSTPWESKLPAGNTQRRSMTLFVRMGGSVAKLRRRFYCIFLRLSVLFWPGWLGKTVVVLDEEKEEDHVFGETLIKHTKQHFPDRTYEVLYEPLPKEPSTLDFAGSPKQPGYNRQLWSSFFIDLYTNDTIIAWMDTDAGFGLPVTEESIFNGTKVRVLGYDCTLNIGWVKTWARTTELALGLPFVADFMTYFPVYIYRDTFTRCREHILKRFNTSNFEEAFKRFYKGFISPVSVILSYAWYFERERYDWNLKICDNLENYNKRFPADHTIRPKHVVDSLSVPQTAFHAQRAGGVRPFVGSSYCLSQEAAGNASEKCSNRTAALIAKGRTIRKRFNNPAPPCSGNKETTCWKILEHHYNQVGFEIKQKKRKLDWQDVETVAKLAIELGITCDNLK